MTANDRNRLTAARWQALLAGYVLGDLSSEEMTQVQQYLAAHPEARADVAALQATLNLLPLSLPENDAPPASLQKRLMQSAAATPQRSQPAASSSPDLTSSASLPPSTMGTSEQQSGGHLRSRSPLLSRVGLGAIAAAAIAAFLSLQNLQLRNHLQLAQQELEFAQNQLARLTEIEAQLASTQIDVAEYQEMLALLRLPENRLLALSGASGFTETSSGSVIIAPQKNRAILTLKGLPEPPTGKAYQLWAMANGKKVYCVEFKPDETGQVLVEIPVVDWAGTPMVSITLEDEGTIPTETSEMVMNGIVI